MAVRPARTAILGRIVVIAVAIIGLLLIGSAKAFADAPPPTNVTVKDVPTQKSKEIRWTAPASRTAEITAYTVRINDQSVAQKTINLTTVDTFAIVRNDELAAGGTITVTATYGANEESARSEGVILQPATGEIPAYQCPPAPYICTPPTPLANPIQAPAAAAPPPTPEIATTSGSIFGGGIKFPAAEEGATPNNKNALETYGMFWGITKIVDTLGGPGDWLLMIPNGLASLFWLGAVFINYIGIALLLWSLTASIYYGLSHAATSLLKGFGGSEMARNMALAGLAGFGIWAARWMNDRSSVIKATFMVIFSTCAAGMLVLFANPIAPFVTQAPINGVIYAFDRQSTWDTDIFTEKSLNISVIGTYDGPGNSQVMREEANRQWMRIYAGFCEMNYGDIEKSTTLTIPEDTDLEGYAKLSLCEGLLKAQTDSNEDALDALRSDDNAGFYDEKGYVQTADEGLWEFYQGQQAWMRLVYGMAAFFSELLMSPLTIGIAIAVGFSAILITVDLFLLLVALIAATFPDFQKKVWNIFGGIATKAIVPAVFTSLILMSFKVADALITAFTSQFGWLTSSLLKSIASVIMIWYVIKQLKRIKRARKTAKEVDSAPDFDGYLGSGNTRSPSAPQPTPVDGGMPSSAAAPVQPRTAGKPRTPTPVG